MSVRQHRPSRSDALRAAIASVRPAESPFGSDPNRRRAVRYVEDQSWRRRTGQQTSAFAPAHQPAPHFTPAAEPTSRPTPAYQHFDATPAGYGSFDSAPVGYGQFEASSWDASEPLYLPSIQLRSRWTDYVPRGLRYGRGRRTLTVASVLAALILTAVGVASIGWQNLPSQTETTQVAVATPTPAAPLPDWSASHRAEAADTSDDEASIALGRSPFRGAPALVEDFPKIQAKPVETAQAEDKQADDKDDAEQPVTPLLRHSSPLGQPLTKLVAFASAPFPYNGMRPSGVPFLDYTSDGRRGHRTRRGILWEDKTFSDNRSILHIPAGFDPQRPAALVVFFHGYGATLERDIGARQQVPQQISASGTNTVLAAPQFAIDARDPSIGKFWQPGGFRRYLAEAAKDFARMQGDPSSEQTFADMPIILVAYSGGFVPAAYALRDIESTGRVRGVVMLDAAYGEFETFADWAAKDHSHFFVSSFTHYTAPMNGEIERLMAARGLDHTTQMPATLSKGGAVFLSANYPHMDYVTQAWTANPIKDILRRLPELRLRDPQAIASVDGRYTQGASVQ